MTIFDKFKTKNIDELVEWLDEHCVFGDAPWTNWFDQTYCKNCESEIVYAPHLGRELECGWCELSDKCKFFQDLNDIPDDKQILRMWLELEIEDD